MCGRPGGPPGPWGPRGALGRGCWGVLAVRCSDVDLSSVVVALTALFPKPAAGSAAQWALGRCPGRTLYAHFLEQSPFVGGGGASSLCKELEFRREPDILLPADDVGPAQGLLCREVTGPLGAVVSSYTLPQAVTQHPPASPLSPPSSPKNLDQEQRHKLTSR